MDIMVTIFDIEICLFTYLGTSSYLATAYLCLGIRIVAKLSPAKLAPA